MDARIVSPAVNVSCVSASAEELKPLVYSEWPNSKKLDPKYPWPGNYTIPKPRDFKNTTVFDDLLGLHSERPPPIFPLLPEKFNSVLAAVQYVKVDGPPDAIFVLFTSNETNTVDQANYMVCSIALTLEPGCSTQYTASMGGGSLTANCDDDNEMAYQASHPTGLHLTDWTPIAEDWALALSLNGGIFNASAANARLLTQLIPRHAALAADKPSIAEALAVLAGCTVVQSALGAPPTEAGWPYSQAEAPGNILAEPRLDAFEAIVRFSDYASGGESWQAVFYLVLVAVFLLDGLCLAYFVHALRRRGLVRDFVDPLNLFALALASPASGRPAGGAGGGEGRRLREKWHVRQGVDEHVYIEGAAAAASPNSPA